MIAADALLRTALLDLGWILANVLCDPRNRGWRDGTATPGGNGSRERNIRNTKPARPAMAAIFLGGWSAVAAPVAAACTTASIISFERIF